MTGTDLVVAVPRCVTCGSTDLTTVTHEQLPLLIHGGYGHGTAYTDTVCDWCGTARTTATDATRPPRRTPR